MAVGLPEPPALNLSNPSLEAAAGFGNAASHAYAAGLQFATALKDQALKGQQQKQTAANEAATNKRISDSDYAREVAELNKTGRPLTQAEISGANSGVPQRTELPPPEDGPPGASGGFADNPTVNPTFENGPNGMAIAPTRQPIDPKNIQYDSRMQPWLVHSPEEMEGIKKTPAPLTNENSVIVPGNLAKAFGMTEGARIPLEHAAGLTSLFNAANGSGGAQHYVTLTSPDGTETQGVVDPKTHEVTPLKPPSGYAVAKPVAEKPAKYTYEPPFVNNEGKVTLIRRGSGENDVPEILKDGKFVPMQGGEAIGPTRKDPNAPKAAKAPKTATPTQLNTIEGKKKAALIRANADYKKATYDYAATDTPEAAQARKDLRQAKQEAQDNYEESLGRYGIDVEHFEYPPEPEPGSPAGAQTAPPQTGAPPAKQVQTPAAAPPAQGKGTPPPAATPAAKAVQPGAPATGPEAKPLAPWSRLAKRGSQAAQITVTDPKGGVHTFRDQASADKFKKLAGIQ